MENEGIMGLPQGQPMQNQGSANQPVYVSSADSYDAALAALGLSSNDPSQADAVRQAVRESISELDLSPTELDALLEILEYMSQNPKEYPQIRQRLIDTDIMDPDDLPEAYDPTYLGIAIMVLNEYQASLAQGAQAPMQMSPVVEGLEPLAMAEGGLADMAKYLASKGRNGDSILAHITPAEARLLKSMGGSGTINPETGLPEFFLKKLFKSVKKAVKKALKNPIVRVIATVALATVLGPAAASVVGAASGAAATGVALSTAQAAAATALASTAATAGVSALAGEKIDAKSLLINAATSYFGAGGTIGGVNPVSSVAKVAGRLPGVTEGGRVAQGIGAGLTSAAVGRAAGLSSREALGLGLQSGVLTGLTYKPQPPAPTGPMAPPDVASGMGGDMSGARAPAPAAASPASMTDAQLFGMGYTPDEISALRVGTAAPVAQTATATPTAAATGSPTAAATGAPTTAPAGGESTFFGRASDFFKKPSFETFTDAFLVNPNAAKGTLGRYAPGVATALTVSGLAGGFKAPPADESPLFDREYTGRDFIRDNPEMFKGGLEPTQLKPYNPVVETPAYFGTPGSRTTGPSSSAGPGPSSIPTYPVSDIPVYMPPQGGMTNMPGGIPQPYNVSGLYGVPLLYGNPVRPTGYARGGVVNNAIRQAASNPVGVAQTQALLFAGPQAAQQAGMAVQALDRGGIMGVQRFKKGGQPTHFPRKIGQINGPGTGTSDSIPAMLSDGEFVFTAKAVRQAGGGSRRKGARRMYKLMKMLEGGNVKGS